MTDLEKILLDALIRAQRNLLDALIRAQRNHHSQMVYLKNSGNSFGAGHWGSSWRSCPAMSCQAALRAEKWAKTKR